MPRSDKLPRGIDRRGDGQYRARVFYMGKQYSIGSFFTLGDAKAALAIARSEIARRAFVPPAERRRAAQLVAEQERKHSLTVRQWATVWLDGLAQAGRSPGTIVSYRSTLDVHVLPVIGDDRLLDVTSDAVTELLQDVRRRKGPWANVARTVRAMFRAAAESRAGGLTESPVRVNLPKPQRARTLASDEIPTPEQVRNLADAMPAELRISVLLAAWCALRLGEVLGLQRRDLERLDDPLRAVLHVRRQWHTKTSPPTYTAPKAGSARSVSIPASLVPALRAHLEQHAGPGREGPLLPSSRDATRPTSQTSFDKAWRVARKATGVEYRFHDLRHVGLTFFAQQGATLTEIMNRGGHTSVEAAMRYQHSAAERDRELTARLDAVLGEDDSNG